MTFDTDNVQTRRREKQNYKSGICEALQLECRPTPRQSFSAHDTSGATENAGVKNTGV